MSKVIFGVDLGGTTVKLGLFDAEGNMLDKWEIVTRKEDSGSHILPDIADSIKAKIEEKNLNAEDIVGVGMGVPGPVKEDGTVIKCANLGWGVFNVQDELAKLVNLPVRVGNDANVAALGEFWQGGGKGYRNMVMVTLGTGVGGGIIVDGHLIYGTNGSAGEIGHMKVEENETRVCGCGKKGCLEQYSSATGVVYMAHQILDNTDEPSTIRDIPNYEAKDIFECAKHDDPVALRCLNSLGKHLGIALANVACVVDPEIIVIGGGVSKSGQIIADAVHKYYTPNAFHACRDCVFTLAKLANDAGIYGGAKLVLGD